MRIMLVAGARPNFMKIAPVHRALCARLGLDVTLVHTGQHYDHAMSRLFFDQLGIPEPDLNLNVGSSTHATQTAEIMRRFEPVVIERRPDLVVVVGDVNSTAACSLVAKKILGVGVAHVEAGLRSFDRTMPEEINRIVTDSLSDLLFTSEPSGDRNLRSEGIPRERIHFVGNVMIDTLRAHLNEAAKTGTVKGLGLQPSGYVLMTLHRPSNVDDADVFSAIMDAVADVSRQLPVVFPVHPRTRLVLDSWAAKRGGSPANLVMMAPLGYLEFLDLTASARLVLTDSGGVQEETTVLGIPCITMRTSTERPVTVDVGTNVIVGQDPGRMLAAVQDVLEGRDKKGRIPDGWDGHAAERIAEIVATWDRRLR